MRPARWCAPAVASLLTLAAAGLFVHEHRRLPEAAVALGTVQRVASERSWRIYGPSRSSDFRAVVRYEVQGRSYEVESRFFGLPRWQPGDSAEVRYTPHDPARAQLQRWDDRYFHTLLLGLWALLCWAAVVGGWVHRRWRTRAGDAFSTP